MTENFASLFLALGIFTAGFISIGPNILAIIGTSMERGRKQGASLALGVGTVSGIWAALTVTGLTALVATHAEAMIMLRYSMPPTSFGWLIKRSGRPVRRRRT